MYNTVLANIPSFVKVVEYSSFSKAAEHFNITKSAISKQVQNLEDALRVKLLNRTTRSVKLTEEGELFFRQACHIMESLTEAERGVQSLNDSPTGVLRINAPESFGLFHLAPALVQFAKAYPDLQLDVEFSDRFVNITEENVDVTIRVASLSDSNLIARKLAPCQMITAAAPEYIDACGMPKHPDELISHYFIEYSYAEKRNELRYRDVDGKEKLAAVTVALRANNGQMQRQAALNGLGIISAPSFIIGNDVKKEKLIQILPEYEITPERNIYALFPQNRYMAAKVRLFVDFLAQRFAGKPYWEV